MKNRRGASGLVLSAVVCLIATSLAACGTNRKLQAGPPAFASRSTTTTVATAPPSTTATTTTAAPQPVSSWPERTITNTGTDEDISPTGADVYWLTVTLNGDGSEDVTPTRYDITTQSVILGSRLTGFVGGTALTVTGGWVWVVYNVGSQTLVERLNLTTLDIVATEHLEVAGGASTSQYPNLAATVGGPLWIADGEDLWALNPSSGQIESHLIAGIQITSMSTSPSGSLLYAGGQQAGQYGMAIIEYEVDTGRELARTFVQGVGPGTVAAGSTGVWVSIRTGMAGSATELSASNLSMIAPAIGPDATFGTFYQIMGVNSGVSSGVLWLTSTDVLTCGDPRLGDVRSMDPVAVSDPVASSQVLYAAASSGGAVAITPPSDCFG